MGWHLPLVPCLMPVQGMPQGSSPGAAVLVKVTWHGSLHQAAGKHSRVCSIVAVVKVDSHDDWADAHSLFCVCPDCSKFLYCWLMAQF